MNRFESSLVGRRYTNTQGLSGTVLEVHPDEDGYYSNARVVIEFDSGYIGEYGIKNVRKGYFKDYGVPNKVGGFDYSKEKKTPIYIYNVWYNMLSRCNNPLDQDYHNYGGRGVYVSNEWHYLESFEKDIKEVTGYSKWMEYPERYTMDKDSKVKGNLVYSKETVQFISIQEQSINRRNVIPVVSIHLESGKRRKFETMAEASRELGLNKSLVRRVVNGGATHTGGYYFERIEEYKEGIKNDYYR